MSEHDPTSGAEGTEPTTNSDSGGPPMAPAKQAAQHGGGGVKMGIRVVLLVVLVALVVALVQDRFIARPAVRRAYETVKNAAEAKNKTGEYEAFSSEDVQNALGRKPSEVISHGPYKVEVYKWMAGLPWKSHSYFAIYNVGRKKPVKLYFVTHEQFELPPFDDAPEPSDAGPPPEDPVLGAGPGAGGPGAGGPGGGRPSRPAGGDNEVDPGSGEPEDPADGVGDPPADPPGDDG